VHRVRGRLQQRILDGFERNAEHFSVFRNNSADIAR
jgi:hypothetical protein